MVIIPRSPQENGNGVKNIRENGTSEHFNDSQQPVVGINPMKNSNRNQQQFEVAVEHQHDKNENSFSQLLFFAKILSSVSFILFKDYYNICKS